MPKDHETWIRRCLELAQEARQNGDHPFGALLLDPHGQLLLEAYNTVVSEQNITGHAELNLIRLARQKYAAEFLAQCSLYSSTEPCPMCAGAIFWGNVRKVVYGLSERGLYLVIGKESQEVLALPCREVFARGAKAIEVIGPILESEARKVHEGFWLGPQNP